VKCDKCGDELEVGSWPWCPHGKVRFFGDDPIEPYWDEHLTKDGVYITSRAQRRKIMDQRGLVPHKNKYENAGRLYFDQGRR
jgi:hypothetical protein